MQVHLRCAPSLNLFLIRRLRENKWHVCIRVIENRVLERHGGVEERKTRFL